MKEPRFPVMSGHMTREDRAACASLPDVPWRFVAEHEPQALRNHDQTVGRLAHRGGLSLWELWCVVHDIGWPSKWNPPKMDGNRSPLCPSVEEMVRLIRAMVEEWETWLERAAEEDGK